jgi:hypothetical protein
MKYFFVLLLSFILFSCGGVDIDDLTKRVRNDIDTKFEEISNQRDVTYSIDEFVIEPVKDGEYVGHLTTTEAGTKMKYEVEINVDGDQYEWRIPE